jgi:hypothetical protein
MAKGPASLQRTYWKTGRTLVNTDELEQAIYMAERRVLEIQASCTVGLARHPLAV